MRDMHERDRGQDAPHHIEQDHLPSYIFTPQSDRPAKKRKPSSPSTHQKRLHSPVVPLLNGLESPAHVQARYTIFQQFWSCQEQRLQRIFDEIDASLLRDVRGYVVQQSDETSDGRLPAGLVKVGCNMSSMNRLVKRLKAALHEGNEARVVVLESGDAPNLKSTVKHIVKEAIGDDAAPSAGRYLPYDLEALHVHLQATGLNKVVVTFQDGEAFDRSVLSDLLALLAAWRDRITFVLIFGIATSIELFEGKLSRATANLLAGTCFDVNGYENLVDRIFMALQVQPDNAVWLGPNVSEVLLDKSQDHFESPESFANGMKYAYMTHFFANPLSVLGSGADTSYQSELCEAIRNTQSFQHHVEHLIASRQTQKARRMLDDDGYLATESARIVRSNRTRTYNALHAAEVLGDLSQVAETSQNVTRSGLVTAALSGDLLGSDDIEQVLLAIKKLPSDKMMICLQSLPDALRHGDHFKPTIARLQHLVDTQDGPGPLASQYDDRKQKRMTFVVGQRLQLQRGSIKLTPQEAQYTRLVDQVLAGLHKYYQESLIQEELFLHEAFICNLRMPLKRVLDPRPRFVIERALASPFDYLVAQAAMTKRAVAASQPATAMAYQLLQESGAVVNVYDWWSTFHSIIGGREGELCEERQAFSLFYEAMAELKMLGMIAGTKKKIDHVAKLAWTGL